MTRIEQPDGGGDRFRTAIDLDEATTAMNAAEDHFVPVLLVDGKTYPVKQVVWDPAKEQMIIEAGSDD